MTDGDNADHQTKFYCSEVSREAEEPLFGSVTQTLVWFILEYPHLMGEKAFAESDLPVSFKAPFSSYVEAIPQSRLLLVKQKTIPIATEITLFLAISRERQPVLYEFRVESYPDLLSLDFTAVLSEDPAFDQNRRKEPLFLVCTNGKRDPCCARWGLPLLSSLNGESPGQVWQTSHVGGHRFAPNLVCFPHGLYYGRVRTTDAGGILEAYRQNRMVLDNYRGRSAYPAPVQAGEYYLRKLTGRSGLDDFTLNHVQALENGTWEVIFDERDQVHRHRLRISAVQSSAQIYESCRSGVTNPILFHQLDQHERIEAE